MKKWPTKPLSEVCIVNPKRGSFEAPAADSEVAFLPMSAVDEDGGGISRPEIREYGQVSKGYTAFCENDVLFAKITPCMENGKAAIARGLLKGKGFGSTEFHVLRPTPCVSAEWIFAFVRRPAFRAEAAANFTGTAGQRRVPAEFFNRVRIPVPPIEEQKRIVGLLEEADQLRKLRAAAEERTADLAPALFDEMFGDSKFECAPLDKIVSLGSGATPSKDKREFWTGQTPWVSPKDMKADEIIDSEDHVSAAAFQESNLKLYPRDTVLIVVRGMILAHTVPIRICRVPVAINQDMKALLPKYTIEPDFLCSALQSRHEYLLGQVSTAGHGTKRLDSGRLKSVSIPMPPLAVQQQFSERLREMGLVASHQSVSRQRLDGLFQSMLYHAFNGEI